MNLENVAENYSKFERIFKSTLSLFSNQPKRNSAQLTQFIKNIKDCNIALTCKT